MKVTQLGCGLVGRAIAEDLAAESGLELTVVDRDEAALEEATSELELAERAVVDLSVAGVTKALVKEQDLVVSAVPGALGYQVVAEAIEAGCAVVDISMMPQDPLSLVAAAKGARVPVLVDCGTAPGLSNVVVGRAASLLDEVEEVLICAGGLPSVRRCPWEFAALFSPDDVLEEYTRPVRIIEDHRVVIKPPLSDIGELEIAGLGTLETFLNDGLRTLLTSIKARQMRETTLRYPGHCERLRLLSRSGFFSREPLEIGGVEVSPREVSKALLSQQWRLEEGEEDLVILRVEVKGRSEGEATVVTYDMVDVYDTEGQVSAMARTTGYTATAMVKLVTSGALGEAIGVLPPEEIGGRAEHYERVLAHLAARSVHIFETVEPAQ